MKIKALIVFLLLVFLVFISSGAKASSNQSENTLIAYKARVVPDLDGTVTQSEWSDAKPYVFQWSNSENISRNQKLAASLAMKHDEKTCTFCLPLMMTMPKTMMLWI